MTDTSLSERLDAIVRMSADRALPSDHKPLMRDIAHVVAEFYGVDINELRHPARRYKAHTRQVAYYLTRMLTDYSYPQIGHYFSRDHTTIITGVRTVYYKLGRDNVLVREIEILKDRIEGERQARSVDSGDNE